MILNYSANFIITVTASWKSKISDILKNNCKTLPCKVTILLLNFRNLQTQTIIQCKPCTIVLQGVVLFCHVEIRIDDIAGRERFI